VPPAAIGYTVSYVRKELDKLKLPDVVSIVNMAGRSAVLPDGKYIAVVAIVRMIFLHTILDAGLV
jgi:hypothetical protein